MQIEIHLRLNLRSNMHSFAQASNENHRDKTKVDAVMFGKRLQAVCEAHFPNAIAACHQFACLHPSQLRRYYAGTNMPSAPVFVAIIEYGISVTWLLTGRGPIYDSTPEGIRLANSGVIVVVPDSDREAIDR